MAKLKSERHHWWPECVSQFWIDADGKATRLSADGETLTIPPKNFGVIQNGHMIKLAKDPTEFCPWDENYEAEFRNADNNFPRVIDWLQQAMCLCLARLQGMHRGHGRQHGGLASVPR